MQAVIMAGGSGTRFWPFSRQAMPKQFLTLFGDRSLIQQAYDRIGSLLGPRQVMVVTNAVQAGPTAEQLPELPGDRIVGEPVGRDTCACIALAAALVAQEDPDANMMVLAADHLIQPQEAFHRAVRATDAFLKDHPDTLMTFGIPPTRPATGYGYLKRAEALGRYEDVAVHRLESFHEKPDQATAGRFLADGGYYWNSGIFAWKAATILEQVERRKPDIHAAAAAIAAAAGTSQFAAVFAERYENLEKVSIDYAVMEHAEKVAMIEAPFEWDDVGSWLALERVRDADPSGNVVLGTHVGRDTANCVVAASPGHVVTTMGVSDLIVVQTPDATLVAHRDQEQEIKKLLADLREQGHADTL